MKYQITKAEMEDPGSFAAELEKLNSEAKRIVETTPKAVKREIAKTEMEALTRTLGLPTDGSISLSLAPDEMSCSISFFPPNLGGALITNDMVAIQLEKNKITKGLDWNTIEETTFACNTELRQFSDVVIAKGLAPKDEIPAHFEIIQESVEADSADNTDGSNHRNKAVDHRNRSTFRIVEKDDVIARLIPKVLGIPGYTVTGRDIPFRRRPNDDLKPGKNVHQIGSEYAASCTGSMKMNDKSFWVDEVLVVDDEIGYRTGHIQFPGDVIIRGEVKDGFFVKSGGDIHCETTLDASNIDCRKDLAVRFGIIGRQDAIVQVGGKVQTKFIENCNLAAGGDIAFSVGIVHSVIKSQGHIRGGRQSAIVGSEITAMNGLEVYQIGSRSGPTSEIIAGVDFRIKERIEWIRDKNIELAMKLTSIENHLKSSPSDKVAKGIREKIKTSIHELNKAALQILPQLTKDDDVSVVVRGTAYPGTSIEISHVPYVVTREMSGVRFLLDKKAGRIKVEKI